MSARGPWGAPLPTSAPGLGSPASVAKTLPRPASAPTDTASPQRGTHGGTHILDLHGRNSPSTGQPRCVMVLAGMKASGAGHALPLSGTLRPSRPSGPSPCGRLWASDRMLNDRSAAGRAGFVAHYSGALSMVLARDRSSGAIERARSARRASEQRMSLRAAAHSGSAFPSRQSSSHSAAP